MNKIVERACRNNVCLASVYRSPGGGRTGTVNRSPNGFYKIFGNPHALHEPDILHNSKAKAYDDQKVTVEWCFDTPRGPVIVRDYWWNGENELSIQAGNKRENNWIKYYLRTMQIDAI